MAMALVPAVLTLNVSPCSFSVAVDMLHAFTTMGLNTRRLAYRFDRYVGDRIGEINCSLER